MYLNLLVLIILSWIWFFSINLTNYINIINIKLYYFYSDLYLSLVIILIWFSIITGLISYTFMFSCIMIFISSLAVSIWLIGFIGYYYDLLILHNNMTLNLLLVTMFNMFIITLRPVTLTLRLIINVSLGHFVMVTSNNFIIIILATIETFIYLVQAFVFSVLLLSYLDNI